MHPNSAFEEYYQNIYRGRWQSLRESLLAPPASVAYGEGLARPYRLDYGSVLAALSLRFPQETMLPEETGGEILDACAAPGGKSLVIAGRMGSGLRLLANELSGERRRRLAAALDAHLDREKRRQVTVSGFDAAAAGGKKRDWGRFGAVLLDAPCSSERHVLADPGALAQWTPARPRFLAKRQWALLSAAFLLLKPGGSLVYATCALSLQENDGVAGRLLEKYGTLPAQTTGRVRLDPPGFPEGEETRYGRIILPDLSGGMGPMYVARFRKDPV
ncbi:MAG: 16S rRNA methyltransferase [Treponema sp.]|jgi:16S rRNA (cytosine1407-C5)-methyltransferase|nr:16S rRNA methyltransferase [Treponema sp.]